MLFRGTEALPRAAMFNDAVESLGASFNAATHGDFTLFEMLSPPESTAPALALLADVFRAPVFADLSLEKAIVREEINEDLDENGVDINPDNVCRAQVFGRHPLGWPITGSLASVAGISREMLVAHHRAFCVTRNMVLTVVGPLPHEAVLAMVARHFTGLTEGEAAAPAPFTIAPPRKSVTVVKNRDSQSVVRVAFATPGATSPAARAIDLVFRVLDDGMSTRLHRRICDERGLAYEISAGVEFFDEVGVADVASSVSPARVPELVHETLDVLAALCLEGPAATELQKAQRRYAFSLASMQDELETLSDFYGTSALFGRHPTPERRLAEVMALSPEDVRRGACLALSPAMMNISVVGDVSARDRRALGDLARQYTERLAVLGDLTLRPALS